MSDRLAVFHDGRIEQIGHPTEVYENPATEFVAGFVGTSNVIETPSGHAVLRPEKIDIVPGTFAASATNATGVIRDVAYLGMITRYRVEIAAGRVMTAVRQNRSTGAGDDTLHVGSEVTLTWSFDDVSALPGRDAVPE